MYVWPLGLALTTCVYVRALHSDLRRPSDHSPLQCARVPLPPRTSLFSVVRVLTRLPQGDAAGRSRLGAVHREAHKLYPRRPGAHQQGLRSLPFLLCGRRRRSTDSFLFYITYAPSRCHPACATTDQRSRSRSRCASSSLCALLRAEPRPRFEGRRIPVAGNVPQRFDYERVAELELWTLRSRTAIPSSSPL
jgi:hypothetical protein